MKQIILQLPDHFSDSPSGYGYDDIYRYTSPYSLLISCAGGKIYRIFCPFDVLAIRDYPGCRYGRYYQVEEVRLDQSGNMLYLIKGSYYPYHLFLIMS